MNGRCPVGKDSVRRVSAWVKPTQERSGLSVRTVLARLAIPASSYYRALTVDRIADSAAARSVRRHAQELLPEERMLILDYTLAFPDPRHRTLAWEMTDAGVVCAYASSVCRVSKSKHLVPEWRLRFACSVRPPGQERATLPDQR